MDERVSLYSYWRSSAAWRVRIALAWHGVPYEYCAVDLVAGAQRAEEYVSEVHPGGLVPALVVDRADGGAPLVLTQSLAIVDYIEARWSGERPRLLPSGPPKVRARVLEVVCAVACDIHPLQNLRVLRGYEGERRREYAADVISSGLAGVESLLARSQSALGVSGPYALGSAPTLADAVLVPQVYNARRWGVDVDARFPRIAAAVAAAEKLPAFLAAHPDAQPDAGTNAA